MVSSVITLERTARVSLAEVGRVNLRTAAAMLIVLACALVISTYSHFSHTWDEPEHLAAGMRLLDRGEYVYDQQHPPLARLAMAVGPYLAGARAFGSPGPSGEYEGRELLYRTGDYGSILTLARLGMVPFLIVLLMAGWAWAKHSFGLLEGALAVFFLISMPPLLGHAGVAALDIPGTAMCTLAFYCLLRWLQSEDWRLAAAAGLAAGLAIGTKLSALPFIALVGLSWLLARLLSRPSDSHKTVLSAGWWAQALSIIALALLTAMSCYGFRFEYLVDAAHARNGALDFLFGASGWDRDLAYWIGRHVPLPVGVEGLIQSIQALLAHNAAGHTSYLLGRLSETGFRHFYLVAIAVKTPLPLLLLGLGGLIYFCRLARRRGWSIAAPVIAFVTLLAFCSLYSHINIGLRHVFVLYPLLAIAAAAFCAFLWRRYSSHAARGALAAVLTLQALPLWTAYPDYLSYFNVLAGKQPEKIIIDSDLDWGQDVRRLQHRLTELRVKKFGFVYLGTVDVTAERLPGVRMMQPFKPATGWIAASVFAREISAKGQGFAWLKKYKPKERVGKSIDLYFIPERSGKK